MVMKKQTARSKTPVNKRRITLYLPTKQMLDDWQNEAKKANMTTSAFVQQIVNSYFENGISTTSKNQYEKRINELSEILRNLRQENLELSKKVTMLNTLTDRYETELKRLRNKDFLDTSFSGVRTYEQELVELLRSGKNIKEHEILDLLHVDPNDTETVKAINQQLQNLLEYGIVKMYRGGYQWKSATKN